MGMLKRNWLIIVLFLIVNSSVLFAVNYAVGYIVNNEFMPYGLSENYLELTRSEQSPDQVREIIDIDDYKNLIVIAELDDSDSVGLLDQQPLHY